jgi:hypothetical protein
VTPSEVNASPLASGTTQSASAAVSAMIAECPKMAHAAANVAASFAAT